MRTTGITLALAMAVSGIAAVSAAQAPAQKPAFEVASVKPNNSGPAGGPAKAGADGARFVASNSALKSVLIFAYRPASGRPLRNSDIIGAPAWTDTDHFDIEAKAESGNTPSAEQMRGMVQSLLQDRFQLKAHWEMREMPAFNLVLDKNGPKFRPSQDQTPIKLDGQGRGSIRTIAKPSPNGIALSMSGTAIPVDTLVGTFQSYAGRPLFDKTGLSGMFDIKLDFFLESSGATPQPGTAADPSGPIFATAIEEQLGLKLDSARGPVEVLVIDSVSKPTEN